MEVKVQCPCGTHYEFEVEPVDGRMPVTVACPECQADGTGLANGYIQQQLNPAPVSAPTAASKPGLSLKRQHEPPAPAPAPLSTTPASSLPPPPTPVAASPFPGVGGTKPVVGAKAVKAKAEGNFTFGLISTLVAGFIGMMVWYGIIKATGIKIGWVAWGVGAFTGLGARIFVPNGNFTLGLVAATCAFMAIVGGEYLSFRNQLDKYMTRMLRGAYEKRVAFAQKAAKAETDDQIRALVAEEEADGGKPDPGAVTAEEIKLFREQELPKLRELANGKPNKQEFESKFKNEIFGHLSQWELLKDSVGVFTAVWLFLGVGSAYKIASNESDDD